MLKALWLTLACAVTAAADASAAPGSLLSPVPALAVAPDAAAEHPRSLGLEGAPNFREEGGYASTNKRHVRWGLVYRSNALNKLTPADAARIEEITLAAVVDLRTREERAQSPSVWQRRPDDVYESPKESLKPLMATVLKDAQTPQGARAGMKSYYASMPDLYRDEYAAMFHRISAGKLPILVHCTAGKDRTGVAMAILLRSLRVPRQVVAADYQLTDQLLPAPDWAKNSHPGGTAAAQDAVARIPVESRLALSQANPEYIGSALDSIEREYGSIDHYLIRGLGLSPAEVASVRRLLTQ